jgi:hypothetical protein
MNDTQLDDDIPLPSYSVPKIISLRDRLLHGLVVQYAEISLSSGDELDVFLDDLMPLMPQGIARGVMFETFRPYLGAPYTQEWWRDMCWRLASNIASLAAGHPLRPWQAPGIQEWVPLQVMRIEPAAVSREGNSRYRLTYRILAGHACPILFRKLHSHEWLKRLSRYVGFTRSLGTRPYSSPYQFTGLRFYVLLDPALSREGQPGFYQMRCTGAVSEHNKATLLRRNRHTASFTCPHAFEHACHHCAIGYLECAAGTHKLNYVQRPCLGCGQPAWFDPEVVTDLCVQCWRKHVVKSV